MTIRCHPLLGLFISSGIALACTVRGQTNTFPSSGDVGIGTTSPGFPLEVIGTGSANIGIISTGHTFLQAIPESGYNTYYDNLTVGSGTYFRTSNGTSADTCALCLLSNGNVGIGTTSPAFPLQVVGRASVLNTDDNTGATYDPIGIGRNTTIGDTYLGFGTNQTNHYGYVQTQDAGVGYYNLLLNPNGGNVGIGTTDPTYPLSVNGTVEAKEVIVQTGWSDYVFDKGYYLAPLSEVERTIKEQQHLPGMPSAKEVAAHGVSVGDMQAKLLAKIEELTLHQIAQEKRMDDQARRIEELEEENWELKNNY